MPWHTTVCQLDLSHFPKFLRDFLLLPNDIFTIRSAESYQNFIETYGTHVIVGSSFGGSFTIQLVGSSKSYSSFDDFKESCQIELDSMTSVSQDRGSQVNAAIDTASGSAVKIATSSSNSQSSSQSDTLNVGGSAGGGVPLIQVRVSAEYSKSTSEESSSSNSASGSFENSENQKSSLRGATTEETKSDNDRAKKLDLDRQEKTAKARDNQKKSKTSRFIVNGGVELGFTQKFYTEEFPEEFDKWIYSVVQDPKSFNFVTRPLTDLLGLSAFDFFPECAMTCSMQTDRETASCQINYKNDNCADQANCAPQQIRVKCKEFDRITAQWIK